MMAGVEKDAVTNFATLLPVRWISVIMELTGISPLIASLITITATCYWLLSKSHSKRILPSPHLSRQTVIIDGRTGVRVSALDHMEDWDWGMETFYDLFKKGLEQSCDDPCFGKRCSLDAPVQWNTYAEVDKAIRQVGSGLANLIGRSEEKIITVGIYGVNSPEWMYTTLACHAYGFVIVPLYDTLGSDGLRHICQQVEPVVVVCDNLKNARNVLEWGTQKLKNVVVIQETMEEAEHIDGHLKIISFSELLKPEKHDTAMICYTSGTSGLPKGVVYTYGSCINSIMCVVQDLRRLDNIPPKYTHYSYLPLAHIFEHFTMALHLYNGARVMFMTTDMSGFMKDVADCRPSYLPVVPRILMRAYQASMSKIGKYHILQWLFNQTIKHRLRQQARGVYVRGGFMDRIFFRPIRQQFGDNIKAIICSSAPVSSDVLDFTRAVFACPVFEIYGSTEVGGMLSCTLLGEVNSGHTGALTPGYQVRLTDVPEMDITYKRDRMGEICVKGGGCTVGYYKDELKTKELFDSDGYLRMGDIGVWTPQGALKIVDRCKNIFKLAQGEYICPGKIEEICSSSPLIAYMYLDGNSLHPYPVAIIQPDFGMLRKRMHEIQFGESSGQTEDSCVKPFSSMSAEELCKNQLARRIIFDEMTTIGRKNGLKGFELPKAIHLTTEQFTIDNGMLTPTLKLSRPNVRRHFATTIQNLCTDTNAKV